MGPLRAHGYELMFCVYAFIRSSCNHGAVRFARAFVQRLCYDVVDARLVRLWLPAVVRGAEVLQLDH